MKNINYKNLITYLFSVLVGILVPVYMTNGYFGLTEAKAELYRIGIIVLIVIFLVFAFIQNDEFKISYKNYLILALMGYMGSSIVSSIFSISFIQSLWGASGWMSGLFSIISGLIIIFIICQSKVNRTLVYDVLAIANIILFGIYILHGAKIDVFSLHVLLTQEQYFQYMGTMGNINWSAGYLALVLPLFIGLYLQSKDNRRYLYLIDILFGCFCFFISNSESVYLSFGIMLLFLLPQVAKNEGYLSRIWDIVLVIGIVILLLNCSVFTDLRNQLDSINQLFLHKVFGIFFIVFGLVCKLLIIKKANITKYIVIVVEVILILACCYFIYTFIVSLLQNNDTWGHGRLMLWNESIKVWSDDFSLLQKIFGLGPDMAIHAFPDLSYHLAVTVSNCHSSIFQNLITNGLVGVFSYLYLVGAIIFAYVKDKRNIISFLPVICFLGHSLANCINPNNIGMFILLLAFFIQDSVKEFSC